MSQQIELAPVVSQRLSIVLGNQFFQINVYQKSDAMYFDLALDGVPIVQTRICRNRIRMLLQTQYVGIVGDFIFIDLQGDEQPQFDGLGTRWLLIYLEPSDLA